MLAAKWSAPSGDTTLTPGSLTNISTTSADYLAIVEMDSTHAIAAWRDYTVSGGIAVCLSVSGSTVTAGDKATVVAGGMYENGLCKIDSTHAILCYEDANNNGRGTAVVLTLSGTTVSVGTPVVYGSVNSLVNSVCLMDSSHAIVTYANGSTHVPYACCLSISGTTLTATSAVAIASSTATSNRCVSLDSSHAIATWGNAGHFYAMCLSLSGTDITPSGTITEVDTLSGYSHGTVTIDSGKVLAVYGDGDAATYSKAVVISLSGTTISVGTAVNVVQNSYYHGIAKFDSTHYMYSGMVDDGSKRGKACCITLSGTTVTVNTFATFSTVDVGYVSPCCVDDTHGVICYVDKNVYKATDVCIVRG